MNSYAKYLPIGTVVMLKGGTKRVMINGFCSMSPDNPDKIYDYTGCVYPEGIVSVETICLFDHSQIEKIFFVGYANDDEERNFKSKLNNLSDGLKKELLEMYKKQNPKTEE